MGAAARGAPLFVWQARLLGTPCPPVQGVRLACFEVDEADVGPQHSTACQHSSAHP